MKKVRNKINSNASNTSSTEYLFEKSKTKNAAQDLQIASRIIKYMHEEEKF